MSPYTVQESRCRIQTAMQEIDVIRQTRSYLQEHGLFNTPLLDVYTDSHPALLGDAGLRPFQRFTLTYDRFSVHPDLVGRLADGETTFAIEAKGDRDLLHGIAGRHADVVRVYFYIRMRRTHEGDSPDALPSVSRNPCCQKWNDSFGEAQMALSDVSPPICDQSH